MDEEQATSSGRGGGSSWAFPLAAASLTLGVLTWAAGTSRLWAPIEFMFLAPLLAIVAVIYGHLAFRLFRKGVKSKLGRGLAIAGLATGYVALSSHLFAILVQLLPEEERHYGPGCNLRLKMIGLAMHLYATDYDDWFPIGPPGTDSSYALGILAYEGQLYIQDASVFLCPNSEDILGDWRIRSGGRVAEGGGLRASSTSYEYVAGLDARPELMLVFDDSPEHHDNGRNVLFVDGHVEYLDEEEFQERLAEQEKLLHWARKVANRDELFRWAEGHPVQE